jgi:hypothetical protein
MDEQSRKMFKKMGMSYTSCWDMYLDDTFEEHCKCLGESLCAPWLNSTSKGRTFKDRSEVSWREIKEKSEEYRLALKEKDPTQYAAEKEIRKLRFGIF